MSGDRRKSIRCPVCQGPAKEDEKAPEGVRCLLSTCLHNHPGVSCPRCGGELEGVSYSRDKIFEYRCADCQNKWQKP